MALSGIWKATGSSSLSVIIRVVGFNWIWISSFPPACWIWLWVRSLLKSPVHWSMPFVNVLRKSMENVEHITVEVAYALPDEQTILEIEVPADCQVEDAIKRSGILERYPQIDLSTDKVGIFGKMCKLNATLRNKDRI